MTAHTIRLVAAWVLALGVIAEVALGPLLLGTIRYHVSRGASVQYLGGELVTLAAAGVVLWATLTSPGRSGTLLATGAALYVVYTLVTVVFGQDYLRHPGNADRWFPLFVVITTAALLCAADGTGRLLRGGTLPDRPAARVTLAILGGAFAVLWIGALVAQRRAPSAEYLADPSLFWLIKYLDLAVVIPTALVTAAVWSGSYRAAGMMVLGFSTWMTAAIAGMQVALVLLEGAATGGLAVAGVMGAASAWCGWLVLTT